MIVAQPVATLRQPPHWATAGTCLAALWLGRTVDHAALRAVLLMPLLFLPGSLLLALILGPRTRPDPVTRAALSVVASLSFLMAIGFVLTVLRIRMDRGSVSLAAGVAIALLGLGAVLRQAAAPLPDGDLGLHGGARRAPRPVSPAGIVGFVAAVCVLALAAVTAAHWLPRPDPPPYASMSLAPPWSNLTGAVPVRAGERLDIPVELRTGAGTPTADYRITAWLDGQLSGRPIERTVPPRTLVVQKVTVVAPAFVTTGSRHRLGLAGTADGGWRVELILYLRGG